jgi:hypothetical protein
MGFNSNASDTKVFKEVKLFTGIHNLKVVAINPTKEKLEEMGYKPQNAPNYLSTEGEGDDEVKKLRLDFHLLGQSPEGEKIMTKVAFFLENQYRVNKDGDKAEWINDFGRTAWSAKGSPEEAPSQFTWFKHESARRSHVGEADVHLFLVNWLNIGPDDEAKMDNFLALFDENYSELQSILASNIDNEVRVLLSVRDNKYQSVYNKYFDRASNRRTNYWDSHIKNQTVNGYALKEDYQNSFAFQEWIEAAVKTDAPATEGGKPKGDDPF